MFLSTTAMAFDVCTTVVAFVAYDAGRFLLWTNVLSLHSYGRWSDAFGIRL